MGDRPIPADVVALLGDLRELENHPDAPDYLSRRDTLRTCLVELLAGYGVTIDDWRRALDATMTNEETQP